MRLGNNRYYVFLSFVLHLSDSDIGGGDWTILGYFVSPWKVQLDRKGLSLTVGNPIQHDYTCMRSGLGIPHL